MLDAITTTEYAQSLGSTPQNITRTSAGLASTTGNQRYKDTVTVSDKAQSLLTRFLTSTGSGPVTIDDIEQSLANTTASVEKRLQSIYRQLGISSDARMEITPGLDGSILVTGDSPHCDRLAEAINADDDLSNSIRKMSADASLLEACKNHRKFAAAYRQDPLAAVERYGYLLDNDRGYQVSFSYQNGHIDTQVHFL